MADFFHLTRRPNLCSCLLASVQIKTPSAVVKKYKLPPTIHTDGRHSSTLVASRDATYWRVEGTLLNLGAVRPVGFFTWNAQTFTERWARRGAVALIALFRPLLYAAHRVFATRVLHTLLRGVSQDRLDLLGEEYFHYYLKPKLNQKSVNKLKQLMAAGSEVVLVSQGLDHVMRPLADFLGVRNLVANRLEFRDGLATGRLLEPVIRPRGGLARLLDRRTDGRVDPDKLVRDLGFSKKPDIIKRAVVSTGRPLPSIRRPLVIFDAHKRIERLSVRESLGGKNILLIGATGFIGKVWLAKILNDVPEIGKIWLLIRRARSVTAQRRFEKIVEESPVFEAFHERYGDELSKFLGDRIEVIEGDVTRAGLGIAPETGETSESRPGCGGQLLGAHRFQSGPARRTRYQRRRYCSTAGFHTRMRSCGYVASFDLLCRWVARWADRRRSFG